MEDQQRRLDSNVLADKVDIQHGENLTGQKPDLYQETLDIEVCDEVCQDQWESEQFKKGNCAKNPGHKGFMDICDLRLEHLPEGCRDNLIIDYIKVAADLVVRVMVKYLSPDRPDGYFLSNKRGRWVRSFGSGWVFNVYRKSTEKDYGHCPCRSCETSATPHRQWADIRVETARHVVYDTVEATNSTCEFFYNSEEVRDQCPKLEGTWVVDSEMKEDRCAMVCVTHNLELITKLEEIVKCRHQLAEELNRSNSWTVVREMAVVVSHPHGCIKQISIGEVTSIQKNWPYQRFYSAATCPGSSGGFVWLPARKKGSLMSDCHYITHHSGGSRCDNNNYSGRMGWFWVR